MIPLQQAHKILAAVGLVRADNEAQQLAQRLLYDPLVASRAQEFILSGAGSAVEALAALHPLEKTALFARLRIAGAAPATPRGNATWTVIANGARKQIRAACTTCNQFLLFQPNVGPHQPGSLPKDFVFSHCGQNEECPEKVFWQWCTLVNERPPVIDKPPYTKESLEAAQREAADAMAKQDRIVALQYGAKF
jgi:hypothetical protein